MRAVLVVVRDPAVRHVLVRYLRDEQLRVEGAESAASASRALDRAAFDAVVVDDGLLDGGPDEVIAALRAHRSGAALGIVAMHEAGTSVRSDATALVKPVRPPALKAALLDAMRRGRA